MQSIGHSKKLKEWGRRTHGVSTVWAALGRSVRRQAMASDHIEGEGRAGPWVKQGSNNSMALFLYCMHSIVGSAPVKY